MDIKTAEIFKKQIKLIDNKNVREIVEKFLNEAPGAFRIAPVKLYGKKTDPVFMKKGFYSKTKDKLIVGGLVKYVKETIKIAKYLMGNNLFSDIVLGMNIENKMDDYHEALSIYKDATIVTLLLCDTYKYNDNKGEELTNRFSHPLDAAKKLKEISDNYSDPYVTEICRLAHNAIERHEGEYCRSNKEPDIILPMPQNGLDMFVNLVINMTFYNPNVGKSEKNEPNGRKKTEKS